MKYIARVTQVLHAGIHKWVTGMQNGKSTNIDMPFPDYVEIDVSDHDAMFYLYQDDGTFCGDTWHEDFQNAKQQALYEYGIPENAWLVE